MFIYLLYYTSPRIEISKYNQSITATDKILTYAI